MRLEAAEGSSPVPKPMHRQGGYHVLETNDAPPGTRYRYALDGGPWLPDPASRRQPDDVHGASEVVDLDFAWTDGAWTGVPLSETVLYELHVGTFTLEGTFEAAIGHLDRLKDLGVTAVELMPLAEVPGGRKARNWGYDGVQLYAVRESFGGVRGLHKFVDACHARGLGVVLDVVYNHLGPEGNHLHHFGPYFSDAYTTPWGSALNFDGPHSDDVRHYFLEHARECFEVHHADGLRLDSVVSVFDRSACPFFEELSELTDAVAKRLGRALHLFGETDDNDPHWVRPRAEGGVGLHAMWADDLHHALHAFMTGERGAYYVDFGSLEKVAQAFFEGSALEGQYAEYRKGRWGRPLGAVAPQRLVVYAQNHDQVGNRADGARLATLLAPPAHRAALALTLLSPHLPLLFMGQEYGETRPFHFFTSFRDPQLREAVRTGRSQVVAESGDPAAMADPEDPASRLSSVLSHDDKSPEGQRLVEMHRAALELRRLFKTEPRPRFTGMSVPDAAFWGAWAGGHTLIAVLDSVPVRLDVRASGALLFDSEGLCESSNPAPPRIEIGTWLEVQGPRVMVYGPERSASSENDR